MLEGPEKSLLDQWLISPATTMLLTEFEACVIPSSADSSNTHNHCTRDFEENIPAYSPFSIHSESSYL